MAERRKRYAVPWYISSQEEEEEDAQMYPCGKAIESKAHIVGECEVRKEERDMLEEETRKTGDCNLDSFVESSEKASAILEIDDGHNRWRNRKGIR